MVKSLFGILVKRIGNSTPSAFFQKAGLFGLLSGPLPPSPVSPSSLAKLNKFNVAFSCCLYFKVTDVSLAKGAILTNAA